MTRKRCFFIGHREAAEEIYPALEQAVEDHIREFGVTEFLVGRYGGFDRMAARAVIAAKTKHPGITLTMLLPYHPTERAVQLPDGFDDSCYPPGQESAPRQVAIVRANRYAVVHSDYLIAYVWHAASNARNLLEYAEERAARCLMSISEIKGAHYTEKTKKEQKTVAEKHGK